MSKFFRGYFNYQSPSFLVKDLYKFNQNKNDTIVKYLNESLIDLGNSINSKNIPENENLKKVVNIVDKILEFNKEQKGKRRLLDLAECIKILTPKQMLQRLPIAFAQVKVGNTSENLLNEIRQIIYYLYTEKEVTKKVYNNIIDQKKYKIEWILYL